LEKRCFLVGRTDSLFKQLVASLLVDLTDEFELCENNAVDPVELLDEIKDARPDMILLEELSPFSEDSMLTHLLINIPNVPVIVISEDSNFMHIVRRETRQLTSSNDLIETLHLV